MHDLSLLTTIAAAFTSAWVLGIITQKLGLSPIVGYLLAGVVIGPYTPGFTGDVHLAQQLAEIGVALLMFGVGLHFHLKDLLAVRAVAVPGALVQSLAATLVGAALFSGVFGMPLGTGLVIGAAMAVASTVVLIRVLMDRNAFHTPEGHTAVGWLIVEDILTVVLLVLIPVLAASAGAAPAAGAAAAPAGGVGIGAIALALGIALLKLGGLVAIVLVAGGRIVPWVMVRVARLRSRELFTLTVLVLSIAVATGSAQAFGVSIALGAFLAGMVVGQSPVSQQAAADALPLRDAFSVLFFVAVGMLFDPSFLVDHPLLLLAGLAIALVVKPLAALVVVVALGRPTRTAFTVALALAQIGEFSFILSDVARRHGLISDVGHNLLVATAIITITINPLLFRLVGPLEALVRTRPRLSRLLNAKADRRLARENADAVARIGHAPPDAPIALVVGYGVVGKSVDRLLREAGLTTIVVDLNADTVAEINAEGRLAVYGDAASGVVLEQAGVERARDMVVTLPHLANRGPVIAQARQLNPSLRIFVRARYLREADDLRAAGATEAIFEEAEAAVALTRLILTTLGADATTIRRETLRVRTETSER